MQSVFQIGTGTWGGCLAAQGLLFPFLIFSKMKPLTGRDVSQTARQCTTPATQNLNGGCSTQNDIPLALKVYVAFLTHSQLTVAFQLQCVWLVVCPERITSKRCTITDVTTRLKTAVKLKYFKRVFSLTSQRSHDSFKKIDGVTRQLVIKIFTTMRTIFG